VNTFDQVKAKWLSESVLASIMATKNEVSNFATENKKSIPFDLAEYFEQLNGTNQEYDNNLFQFNSLFEFENLVVRFQDWKGSPDHKQLLTKLKDPQNYYVFGNYCFQMFIYVIKLSESKDQENEILICCDGQYQKICTHFIEFLTLYLNDDPKLYFVDEVT
jgi:hypothetical protein